MEIKKKSLSLFWKCFITYLISTIFFLASQFYMFHETTRLWQQSYTEQIKSSLEHNTKSLSSDLSNFYYLPKIMNISDHFKELARETDIYSSSHSRLISSAMNDLSDQVTFFMPINDVIILLKESNLCITPNSFYMSPSELTTYYRYKNTNIIDTIDRKVARNTSLEMYPLDSISICGGPYTQYLTCLIKESSDNCTYIFLIEKSRILDYFQLSNLPDSVHFVLKNESGDVLLEYGNTSISDNDLSEKYVDFTSVVPAIKSFATISIPEYYFTTVTKEAEKKVYGILLLSLFTGLILCFVFSQINSQPIKDLINAHHIPKDNESTNELVTIYNYLSESKEQKRTMEEKILSGILMRAFSGLPVNADDFADITKSTFLFSSSARVAVVRYRVSPDSQEFQSLILYQLKEHMPAEFIIEPLNRQELGLVIPPSDDAVFQLKNYLDEINEELSSTNQIICGVSAPFVSPDQFSDAVQQARFSLPSGTERFVVFNGFDEVVSQSTFSLDYKEFQNALFNWNIKRVDELIQEYANAVMKESSSVAQEVFYTLLAFIRDAADAVNVSPDFIKEYRFTRNISGDENIRALSSLTNYLFEKKTVNQTDEKKIRNREIINYVHTHFDDPLLSAASVAEKYKLSERTINTILNEETGMSFASYLTSVRMQKAGELLRDTTLDAEMVSEKVGLTLSTFYRNFKKHYRMTPAAYKMQFVSDELNK